MICRCSFVILSLLVIGSPLWSQPTFRWPVDMGGVSNLTGNLGEPRPDNIENPTVHLHHWHKGIDIPKLNGETIRIPAASQISGGILPSCKEEPHGCVYTKNAYPISLFRFLFRGIKL